IASHPAAPPYSTDAGPDETSAATRGVASPTRLRAFMKKDPRALPGEFRALAPPRPPIALQRWSLRRVALAAAMLGAIVLAAVVGGQAFFPAEDIGAYPPVCGTGHSMILSAQAVPSAAMLPCIAALPPGGGSGGRALRRRKVPPLAGPRPRRPPGHPRPPAPHLRHRRYPPDPLRPARPAAVRPCGQPDPSVHRAPHLHLPRRLRHL